MALTPPDPALQGIWMAVCLYAVRAAVAMSLKFWQGTWKKIRL